MERGVVLDTAGGCGNSCWWKNPPPLAPVELRTGYTSFGVNVRGLSAGDGIALVGVEPAEASTRRLGREVEDETG